MIYIVVGQGKRYGWLREGGIMYCTVRSGKMAWWGKCGVKITTGEAGDFRREEVKGVSE